MRERKKIAKNNQSERAEPESGSSIGSVRESPIGGVRESPIGGVRESPIGGVRESRLGADINVVINLNDINVVINLVPPKIQSKEDK